MNWQQGNKQTEKGEVAFKYSMLSELKEKVQPDPPTEFGLDDNKIKVLSQSKTIDAPLLTVLSIIENFSFRSKWMEGVKSVDHVSHPINHLGVKHRSVFNNRSMIFIQAHSAKVMIRLLTVKPMKRKQSPFILH